MFRKGEQNVLKEHKRALLCKSIQGDEIHLTLEEYDSQ